MTSHANKTAQKTDDKKNSCRNYLGTQISGWRIATATAISKMKQEASRWSRKNFEVIQQCEEIN